MDDTEKYRGMFENAIEGIYQSTPDGRYLAVNKALAKMYGYEHPDELINEVSDIQNQVYVDPAFRRRFKEEIESTGVVRGLEYQVRRHDGATIWISETARVVRQPDGTPLYYEGFIEDITERKRHVAEREQLIQELQSALTEIKTLAGLIPICAWCKSVRNDAGYWSTVEEYVRSRTGATVSHGMCPECIRRIQAGLPQR